MAAEAEYYTFHETSTARLWKWVTVESLSTPRRTVKRIAGGGVAGVAQGIQHTTGDMFRQELEDIIGDVPPSLLEPGQDTERFNRLDELNYNLQQEIAAQYRHSKKVAQAQLDSCILAAANAVLERTAQDPLWFTQDYIFVFYLVETVLRNFASGKMLVTQKIPKKYGGFHAAPVYVKLVQVLSDTHPARPIKWMVRFQSRTILFFCPLLLSHSCVQLLKDATHDGVMETALRHNASRFTAFSEAIEGYFRKGLLHLEDNVYNPDDFVLYRLHDAANLMRNMDCTSWKTYFKRVCGGIRGSYLQRGVADPREFLLRLLPRHADFFSPRLSCLDLVSAAMLKSLSFSICSPLWVNTLIQTYLVYEDLAKQAVARAEIAHTLAYPDNTMYNILGQHQLKSANFALDAAKTLVLVFETDEANAIRVSRAQAGRAPELEGPLEFLSRMVQRILALPPSSHPQLILKKLYDSVVTYSTSNTPHILEAIRRIVASSFADQHPNRLHAYQQELIWLQTGAVTRSCVEGWVDKSPEMSLEVDQWSRLFNLAYSVPDDDSEQLLHVCKFLKAASAYAKRLDYVARQASVARQAVVTRSSASRSNVFTTVSEWINPIQTTQEALPTARPPYLRTFTELMFSFFQKTFSLQKMSVLDAQVGMILHYLPDIFGTSFDFFCAVSAQQLINLLNNCPQCPFVTAFADALFTFLRPRPNEPESEKHYLEWVPGLNAQYLASFEVTRDHIGKVLDYCGMLMIGFFKQQIDDTLLRRVGDILPSANTIPRLCFDLPQCTMFLKHFHLFQPYLKLSDGIQQYHGHIVVLRNLLGSFSALFFEEQLTLRDLQRLFDSYDDIRCIWLDAMNVPAFSKEKVEEQLLEFERLRAEFDVYSKFVRWLDEKNMEKAAEINNLSTQALEQMAGMALTDLRSKFREIKNCVNLFGEENQQFVEYFLVHKSALFSAYIKEELEKAQDLENVVDDSSDQDDEEKPMLSVSGARDAIAAARRAMHNLLRNDDVKLSELNAASKAIVDAGRDPSEEMATVSGFPGFKSQNQVTIPKERVEAFRKALELSTLADRLPVMFHVVEHHLFSLRGCTESGTYNQLKKVYTDQLTPEKRDALTFRDVPACLDEVNQLLGGMENKSFGLDLFDAVRACAPFFTFVVEEQFYSEPGDGESQNITRFNKSIHLITGLLMGEEYNGDILADLPFARDLIEPFVLASVMGTGFDELLSKINNLEKDIAKLQIGRIALRNRERYQERVGNAGESADMNDIRLQRLECLTTVKDHMAMIESWFRTNSVGQASKIVEQQVAEILRSGKYEMKLPKELNPLAPPVFTAVYCDKSNLEHQLSQLQLKDLVMRVIFDESASKEAATDAPGGELSGGAAAEADPLARPQMLPRCYSDGSASNREEDDDNGFRLFKQKHLKLEDIQSLLQQLQIAGHPQFQRVVVDTIQYILEQHSVESLGHEVDRLTRELHKWQDDLKLLRQELPELFYFNTRQLLQLLRLFKGLVGANEVDVSVEDIHEIMSMLRLVPTITCSQAHVQELLKEAELDSEALIVEQVRSVAEFIEQVAGSVRVGPRWKAGDELIYTHSDGTRENVTVVKVSSEDGEPYYTILIPSTGRERQTQQPRLSPVPAQQERRQRVVQVCLANKDVCKGALLRLVVQLYCGEANLFTGNPLGTLSLSELLWCSAETTESALKLFLDRVLHHSSRQFTIIEVNALPAMLREQVLQFQLTMADVQGSRINYIYTKDLSEYDGASTSASSWIPTDRFGDIGAAKPIIDTDAFKQAADKINAHTSTSIETVCLCSAKSGDGKTYVAKNELQRAKQEGCSVATLAINEGFDYSVAITQLAAVVAKALAASNASGEPPKLALLLAVSCFAPFSQLNLFLFELLVLRTVCDERTGLVFTFPSGCTCRIFIEVPTPLIGEAHGRDTLSIGPPRTCDQIRASFPRWDESTGMLPLLPVVHFIAELRLVDSTNNDFDFSTLEEEFGEETVHGMLRLMKAYAKEHPTSPEPDGPYRRKMIDIMPNEVADVEMMYECPGRFLRDGLDWSVSFDKLPLEEGDTNVLLQQFVGEINRLTNGDVELDRKLQLSASMRYMMPRCDFFRGSFRISMDAQYHFLRSILFHTFLRESGNLCSNKLRKSWSEFPHAFLLRGSEDWTVVSLDPEQLKTMPGNAFIDDGLHSDRQMCKRELRASIPSFASLRDTETLGDLLAVALLGGDERAKRQLRNMVRGEQYVLTLDFVMKMIHIDDRRLARVPTIIMGETGVGKTSLLRMYSLIVFHNQIEEFRQKRDGRLYEQLKIFASELPTEEEMHAVAVQTMELRREQILSDGINACTLTEEVCRMYIDMTQWQAMDGMWAVDFQRALVNFTLQTIQKNPVLDLPQLLFLLERSPQVAESSWHFDDIMRMENSQDQSQAVSESMSRVCEDIRSTMKKWKSMHPKNKAVYEERAAGSTFESLHVFCFGCEREDATYGPEDVVNALLVLLMTPSKELFFDIQVHAAMTSNQLQTELAPIFELANAVPTFTLTVFFDEVNTASILGDFKEVMLDRSFHGEPLPHNIFFVAAVNPCRKVDSSQRTDDGRIAHVSGYQVQEIPPSMREVVWEYGAQSTEQEKDYITAKLQILMSQESEAAEADGEPPISFAKYADIFMEYIHGAQRFVRAWFGEGSVSVRDLERSFALLTFFVRHHKERQKAEQAAANEQSLGMFFLAGHTSSAPRREEHLVTRCLLLSIGVTYYLRLPTEYICSGEGDEHRKEELQDLNPELQWQAHNGQPVNLREQFEKMINDKVEVSADAFQEYNLDACALLYQEDKVPWKRLGPVLDDEMVMYLDNAELPSGIACNQALKENFFCTVVCIENRIPLIIIGPPGCSKTLSFKIAAETMRGDKSPNKFFSTFADIHGDVFIYQCSEHSTSNEIKTVFDRAIERQNRHEQQGMASRRCVVFLDEVGLPKDDTESLKIIHYYLDARDVASVLITNRPLDAAKSNRAVNLYRPEPTTEDLRELAKGCLFGKLANANEGEELYGPHLDKVDAFCDAYHELTEESNREAANGGKKGVFARRFQLRDFYHFIRFFSRHASAPGPDAIVAEIQPLRVLQSLERNFNGVSNKQFREIVEKFFGKLRNRLGENWKVPAEAEFRKRLDVLKNSLEDRNREGANLNDSAARFKLVIDETDDDSAARLLKMIGVIDSQNTDVFHLSGFDADDTDHVKSSVISRIKLAMEKGRTVFLINCNSIHGSFYDVFNQHYLPRRDRDGTFTYFANVAIGSYSRPCKVHPNFQCIVHLPASELEHTPLPFLNRFEKYLINVDDILEHKMSEQKHSPGSRMILRKVREKCTQFADFVGCDSFYGNDPSNASVSSALLAALDAQQFIEWDESKGEVGYSKAEHWRSLIQIVISRLLQVAIPERVFLKRTALQPNYLQHYNQNQEHFVLKDFLAMLMTTGGKVAEMGVSKVAAASTPRATTSSSANPMSSTPRSAEPNGGYDSEEFEEKEEEDAEWTKNQQEGKQKEEDDGFETADEMEEEGGKPVQYSRPRKLGNRHIVFTRNTSNLDSLPTLPRERASVQHAEENALVRPRKNIAARALERVRSLVGRARSSADPGFELGAYELQAQYDIRQADLLKQLVCDRLDAELLRSSQSPVHILKLEAFASQQAVESALQRFIKDEHAELLLFMVNMNRTRKRLVNQLRGVIDRMQTPNKVFVMLLAFQPESLHIAPCYPTLFMHGWDFHYLDSCGGGNTQQEPIAVKDWFSVGCGLQQTIQAHPRSQDPEGALLALLSRSYEVVVGNLHGSGNRPSQEDSTNPILPFYSRGATLGTRAACLDCFMESIPQLQFALTTMFHSLWTPNVVKYFLQEAVTRRTYCSLSRTLRGDFQELFGVFLIEVFKFLCGTDMDLCTLYAMTTDVQVQGEVELVIHCLLQLFTLPSVPELKRKAGSPSHVLPSLNGARMQRFPLSRTIWSAIIVLLEEVTLSLQLDERGKVACIANKVRACIQQDHTGLASIISCIEQSEALFERLLVDFASIRLALPASWDSVPSEFGDPLDIILAWLRSSSSIDGRSCDVVGLASCLWVEEQSTGTLSKHVLMLRKLCRSTGLIPTNMTPFECRCAAGTCSCLIGETQRELFLQLPVGQRSFGDVMKPLINLQPGFNKAEYQRDFNRLVVVSLWIQLKSELHRECEVQEMAGGAQKIEQSSLFLWSGRFQTVRVLLSLQPADDNVPRIFAMELASVVLRNPPRVGIEEGKAPEPVMTKGMVELAKQCLGTQLGQGDAVNLRNSFDKLNQAEIAIDKKAVAEELLSRYLLQLEKATPDELVKQSVIEFVRILGDTEHPIEDQLLTKHMRHAFVRKLIASTQPFEEEGQSDVELRRRREMFALLMGAFEAELVRGQPVTATWKREGDQNKLYYAPSFLQTEREHSAGMMQQPLADSLFVYYHDMHRKQLGRVQSNQVFDSVERTLKHATEQKEKAVEAVTAGVAIGEISEQCRALVASALVLQIELASKRLVMVHHVSRLVVRGYEHLRDAIERRAEANRELMAETFHSSSGSCEYQSLLFHLVKSSTGSGGQKISEFLDLTEACNLLGQWTLPWKMAFCSNKIREEVQQKIDDARKHAEELMNIRCPHCQQAFIDFRGCFAVVCTCEKYFCGWCLSKHPDSREAHKHVWDSSTNSTHCTKRFPESDQWYGEPEQFLACHRMQQSEAMLQYLQGIDDIDARGSVVQELAPLLRDLTESCPQNLVEQMEALIQEHSGQVGADELVDKVATLAEIYPIALDLSEEETLENCAHALVNSESFAGEFKVLKKFVADRKKWAHLQLIPYAVEMYRWINHTLCNMVTEENAMEMPLLTLIRKYKLKDRRQGVRIERLFEKMRGLWNKFWHAEFGAKKAGNFSNECNPDATFEQMTKDTPLSYFLSVHDPEAQDYILRIVDNIVSYQNTFVQLTDSLTGAGDELPIDHVTRSALLQYEAFQFESHVQAYITGDGKGRLSFNLQRLQEHILRHSSPVPLMSAPMGLRMVFSFLQENGKGISPGRPINLKAMLPDEFQEPLPEDAMAQLTGRYDQLKEEETSTILSEIQRVGQLVVSVDKEQADEATKESTIVQFMQELEIQPADDNQMAFVLTFQMKHLNELATFFAQKLKNEDHLYITIPASAKVPMDEEVAQYLEQMLDATTMSMDATEARQKLCSFIEDMRKTEAHMLGPEKLESSISSFFVEAYIYEADEFPVGILPEGCCGRNYKMLVRMLREKVWQLEKRHRDESKAKSKVQRPWSELGDEDVLDARKQEESERARASSLDTLEEGSEMPDPWIDALDEPASRSDSEHDLIPVLKSASLVQASKLLDLPPLENGVVTEFIVKPVGAGDRLLTELVPAGCALADFVSGWSLAIATGDTLQTPDLEALVPDAERQAMAVAAPGSLVLTYASRITIRYSGKCEQVMHAFEEKGSSVRAVYNDGSSNAGFQFIFQCSMFMICVLVHEGEDEDEGGEDGGDVYETNAIGRQRGEGELRIQQLASVAYSTSATCSSIKDEEMLEEKSWHVSAISIQGVVRQHLALMREQMASEPQEEEETKVDAGTPRSATPIEETPYAAADAAADGADAVFYRAAKATTSIFYSRAR
jgi:hypothetical protein